MKEKLHLNFDRLVQPRLESCVLSVTGSDGRLRHKETWRDGEAHPQEASFRWAKGLMTLSLVLIRLRLEAGNGGRTPLLSGITGSAAATFDNLVHKADGMAWLREMLTVGAADTARTRLMRWFDRQNSQGNNRQRPIRIFSRSGAGGLLAENLQVTHAGISVDERGLRELEEQLAAALGEEAWASANFQRMNSRAFSSSASVL